MRWASEFSQRVGAELSFLHVAPPFRDAAGLSSAKEIEQDICAALRARLDAMRQSAWIGGTLRVAVGGVAETVTEQAGQQGADLVLIGRCLLPSPTEACEATLTRSFSSRRDR
jgi:nucleotide-binding universal stress UspA family protein